MSAQDRPEGLEPTFRTEIRAHARAERQRIRARLRPGLMLDEDFDDPGVGYRKPHHRWHEARAQRPLPRWRVRRQQLRRQARAERGRPA
jgi:hypothetical protein